MANLGRAYPRLFRRDYGMRLPFANFNYLARQLKVRMAGGQWASSGWPLTDMISDPGVADDDNEWIEWSFPYSSVIYPSSTFVVRWKLDHTAAWWQPYWLWTLTPTLWRYNQTKPGLTFPISWPETNGGSWQKPDTSPEFLMGTVSQGPALWADI